jgi:hypothetical protein
MHYLTKPVHPSLPTLATETIRSPLSNALNSQLAVGPTNGSYAIPPRPKPGRKPATDEPQTKRKAQNREAQRNFRQRKAQKLNELETEIERKEHQYREERDALIARVRQLEEEQRNHADQLQQQLNKHAVQIKTLEQERDYWKSKFEASQSAQTHPKPTSPNHNVSHTRSSDGRAPPLNIATDSKEVNPIPRISKSAADGCGNCEENGSCPCVDSLINIPSTQPGPEPLSPMSDVRMSDAYGNSHTSNGFEDREIDFTSKEKRPVTTSEQQPECGFCTDTENCICRLTENVESQNSVPVSLLMNSQTSVSRRAPGSCPKCQSDPKQREWCRSLAKMHKLEEKESFTLAPIEETPRHPSIYSVGCNETYQFVGQVLPNSNRMDWAASLSPVPHGSSRPIILPSLRHIGDRSYSAYEINSASILATLGKFDRRMSDYPPKVREDIEALQNPRRHAIESESKSSMLSPPESSSKIRSPSSLDRVLN